MPAMSAIAFLLMALAPLAVYAQSCSGVPPFQVPDSTGFPAACTGMASGQQCYAICRPGFTSSPGPSSLCSAGVWQPVTGKCLRVCSGTPPAALLTNGATWPVSCANSIALGGVCNATCPGYGAPSIRCTSAGWDANTFVGKCSATPVCSGMPAVATPNGVFNAKDCSDTPVGSVCTGTCNAGFSGPRSPPNVACLADPSSPSGGSWDTTVNGACDKGGCNSATSSFSVGLWGDLPYNDVQAQVGVPNLIADMNSRNLAFSVYDGDWKAGSGNPNSFTPSTCSAALYAQAMNYLNSLKAPAIYTPGDNEWTDCDRANNGGYNSRERLDYVRSYFFNTSYSQGQTKLKLEVQTDALCLNANGSYVACVENRRWTYNGVMFATLNVVGSCNNLCDTNPDPAEYAARNQANIVWLQSTFAAAKARNNSAIMLVTQADPGFDLADGTRAPTRDPNSLNETDGAPDGYKEYLLALRAEVLAFKKPVAYVHGDSHYFRIDRPFLTASGVRMVNFTRVETPGDNQGNANNDVNWVHARVDPCSREVFSYSVVNVPGNNPTQQARRR